MSDDLGRAFRDLRIGELIRPAQSIRRDAAVDTAIDLTGRVNPKAAPKPSPQVLSWGPSSTTRQRVVRAGTVVLLSVYATTAPTTGDATVTLTQTTQDGGTETLASVKVPDGSNFSDGDTQSGLPVQVPNGGWLFASVTTANGAAGVNISVTVEAIQ